jgi:hypothetical protein
MELHYRGAAYEAAADAIETTDNGLTGQYRGAALRFRRPKRIAEEPHRSGMKYRGIAIH